MKLTNSRERFYKFFYGNKDYSGVSFKKGLNVFQGKFDIYEHSMTNGFHFVELEHFTEHIIYGSSIAEILIPEDATVTKYGIVYSADKIIVTEFRKFDFDVFHELMHFKHLQEMSEMQDIENVVRWAVLNGDHKMLEGIMEYYPISKIMRAVKPYLYESIVKFDLPLAYILIAESMFIGTESLQHFVEMSKCSITIAARIYENTPVATRGLMMLYAANLEDKELLKEILKAEQKCDEKAVPYLLQSQMLIESTAKI